MQQHESKSSSQSPQSLDAVSYLNEQIQEGAEIKVINHRTSYVGRNWLITRVGTDFVVFKTDNGSEWIVPRDASAQFIVTPKAPAR